MSTDARISDLNNQKEKALRQSEVDAMNASLAKLKGDHVAAKQHTENSKQNKKLAQDAQDSIDEIENNQQYDDCDEESQEEVCRIDCFLSSVGEALQRFQDGECIEDIQDIEYSDLQLAYCLLNSLNSDEDTHVFDVIRQARTVEVEEQEQEEVEDTAAEEEDDDDTAENDAEDEEEIDDDYDEEDDDDEVDNEIENEIYDEIENELGYDYEEDDEDYD